MLLLLLSRTERVHAALLFGVIVAAVSASIPVKPCPGRIQCTKAGREICKPGSSRCGPCILPLQEDEGGHCVAVNSKHGEDTSLPDLDEQIDFLSSVIGKQQGSDVSQSDPPKPKNDSALKSASQLTTEKPFTRKPPTPQTPKPPVAQTKAPGRGKPISTTFSQDALFIIVMSAFIILGTVAFIVAAICWFRIQKESHLTQKVDYPAFPSVGSSSSNSSSCQPGDKKLAHSAHMFHYQHQKQQMLSMEKYNSLHKHKVEPKVLEPGTTSEEETEEGDFTVYECPGLAPTGEMEVKNPLFDDSTLQDGCNHK